MDLLLLVVIVLFVVIMQHIKTWPKTLILSKLKTVKLFNLSKTSTALISVYMPLVVIYALKFILVKLSAVFSYVGIHTAIFGITAHWILKRQYYRHITTRTTLIFHIRINLFQNAIQLLSYSNLQIPI